MEGAESPPGAWSHTTIAACTGDNIVVIRAASRVDPPDSEGQLQLDFGKGIIIQRNIASTGMERLRKVRRRVPRGAGQSLSAPVGALMWILTALPHVL